MENKKIEDFANCRINPTYGCVQNWLNQWRLLNLRPHTGQGVIMKLEEKKETYATNRIFILTLIMKRAHDLPLSKDIDLWTQLVLLIMKTIALHFTYSMCLQQLL
ncbi:unnamed protein product [Macrosiphum euphorbiae]|nr:unnamed protein product [Macrosiphum euphorbiae]